MFPKFSRIIERNSSYTRSEATWIGDWRLCLHRLGADLDLVGNNQPGLSKQNKTLPSPYPLLSSHQSLETPETRLVFKIFRLSVHFYRQSSSKSFSPALEAKKRPSKSFVFLSRNSSCTYPAMSESRYVECLVACLRLSLRTISSSTAILTMVQTRAFSMVEQPSSAQHYES